MSSTLKSLFSPFLLCSSVTAWLYEGLSAMNWRLLKRTHKNQTYMQWIQVYSPDLYKTARYLILLQTLCGQVHKRRLKKGKRYIQFSTTHLFPPTSSGMCTYKYVSLPHLTTLHLMQILQTTQKYIKQMGHYAESNHTLLKRVCRATEDISSLSSYLTSESD